MRGKRQSNADNLFTETVAPLLASRCIPCHGPTRQESNLQVHNREHLLAGGQSGPAVIPGRASNSLLVQLVAGTGPVTMPPSGERLTGEEVSALRRWIDAEAPWTAASGKFLSMAHWSFRPLVAPPLPTVVDEAWCRTPADRHIRGWSRVVFRLPPRPTAQSSFGG